MMTNGANDVMMRRYPLRLGDFEALYKDKANTKLRLLTSCPAGRCWATSPERRIPRQTSAASADYDTPAERIELLSLQKTLTMISVQI